MRSGCSTFMVATSALALILSGCGSQDAAIGAGGSLETPTSFCAPTRVAPTLAQSGELLYVTDENATIEDRKRRGDRTTVRLVSVDGDAGAAGADGDGRALTGLDGAPRSPVWSPDGMRIAFIATTGEGAGRRQDLFVMAHDGSGARRLTEIGGVVGRPAWSPDGMRLLFVEDQQLGDGVREIGVYVVNADGSDLTRVSPEGWRGASVAILPRWTPDGSGIIFPVEPEHPDDRYQLVVANPDGSAARDLEEILPIDTEPIWSPDGCRIVTSRQAGERGEDLDLAVVDEDGEPRPLTDGPSTDFAPAWSPDGGTIAFIRMGTPAGPDPVQMTKDASGNLFLIDVDGTNERQLTTFAWVKMMPPVWSPDGSQLAFVAYHYETETWELHVINADGSNLQTLSGTIARGEVYPAWRPAS